ncbi:MAG: dihydropteroate synthase [Chlamydiales bacterium]|nr:dihydropteroate synthase [Chlamydiales bacterium]
MISTKIMGILNVTPDSCYDGGQYDTLDRAVAQAQKLCADGADILDIGGESTRPGADSVSIEEELRRVIPVIQAVRPHVRIPISVDTSKAEVAAAAVEAGATLINDVTGFSDYAMREVAVSTETEICVMHMQGQPRTMQLNPHYPEGIITHLLNWFDQRIQELVDFGIKEENIILDPGIGFGKTVAHNIEIIQNLPELRALGFRVLVGISRKSFMAKITGKDRDELLPPTIAINTLMMMENVDIIRVHDVAEHRMVREVLEPLTACSGCSCC